MAAIGSAVISGIVSFFTSKAMKITVAIGTLILLFALIPFKLELPGEIYLMFTSGTINNFFKSVSYFLPINFMLMCFIVVFASKYLHIFWNLIKFLWDKIAGTN